MVNDLKKRCKRCNLIKRVTLFQSLASKNCIECNDYLTATNKQFIGANEVGEIKARKCLKCSKEFTSRGNRLCDSCNNINRQYDGEVYGITK